MMLLSGNGTEHNKGSGVPGGVEDPSTSTDSGLAGLWLVAVRGRISKSSHDYGTQSSLLGIGAYICCYCTHPSHLRSLKALRTSLAGMKIDPGLISTTCRTGPSQSSSTRSAKFVHRLKHGGLPLSLFWLRDVQYELGPSPNPCSLKQPIQASCFPFKIQPASSAAWQYQPRLNLLEMDSASVCALLRMYQRRNLFNGHLSWTLYRLHLHTSH